MIEKKNDFQELWLLDKPTQKTHLISGTKGVCEPKQHRILMGRIRFCTTENVKKNYLKFVTIDNKEFFRMITLETIVEKSPNFVRISKNTIINTEHIKKRHDWLFIWSDEQMFKISRVFRAEIKLKLGDKV